MKNRKPWLAATLSFLCPGVGQLYNGNIRWALSALPIGAILTLISAIYLFDSLNKLMGALALGFVFDTIYAVQAYREAKRKGAMELGKYQSWWAYAAFAVVLYGLPDGYGLFLPERFLSFQIPSESMVPNLLIGDRLVADGWAYWKKEPVRGDVVVFKFPRDESVIYVKRLVGLPGDTVELKE
ncbi:MAG: signal peptidase I, partial [Proteobacteria bacterium]